MVSIGTFVNFGVLTALGVIGPLVVAIWWVKTRKEKISTVLLGAATWIIFALVLESIPKFFLLTPMLPIGKTILSNVALFTAVGALLAGIFEETGRLIVFKFLLKKRKNREASISHGIGHGGFEALYILVSTGAQYLMFAVMINNGTFKNLIAQISAAGLDTAAYEAIPQQIASWTFATSLLMVAERAFAMLIHVGLSILVFYAVKKARMSLFFLAVLLHALMDVPAALYQAGVLNVYIAETMVAVYSVIFFVIVLRTLYQKDGKSTEPRMTITE